MTTPTTARIGVSAVVAALLASALATPAAAAPVSLKSGSVSPPIIVGGDGAQQTITLSVPAPAGGVHISLYGDLVYGASTGRTAFVPAGATSVTFSFRTAAPSTQVVRALWAQVQGSPLTKIAEVTILPANPSTRAVRELRIDAAAAKVGSTVNGTVELINPAPSGGIAVSLWSNTSYGPGLYVPPFVTVSAGSTTATFPIMVTRADEPAAVHPSADLGTPIVHRGADRTARLAERIRLEKPQLSNTNRDRASAEVERCPSTRRPGFLGLRVDQVDRHETPVRTVVWFQQQPRQTAALPRGAELDPDRREPANLRLCGRDLPAGVRGDAIHSIRRSRLTSLIRTTISLV